MKTSHAVKNNTLSGIVSATLGIAVMLVLLIGALPTPAGAATIGTNSAYCVDVPATLIGGTVEFSGVVKFVVCFLEQSIVPFLFAIAVCVFFWGMVKFMSNADSSEREQGKQFMLWGVIALAVMFCVWGLVDLFGKTFQVKSVIPQLPVN